MPRRLGAVLGLGMAVAMAALPALPRHNKHHQKTEATREALLQAARRIFVRDGFEASRIEDVVAAAGRTRGAFYANFRAKEDLLFAIYEQQQPY